MTKANTTSTQRLTTTKRQLKVKQGFHSYQLKQQTNRRSTISEISLKGKWLNDAGFSVHSSVNIQVQRGKLVITTE